MARSFSLLFAVDIFGFTLGTIRDMLQLGT